MEAIKKSLIVLFLLFLFVGCAKSTNYSKENKELVFSKYKDILVNVPLSNPTKNYHSSTNCVINSYTITDLNNKYGKLFFESIDLENQCSWTGLASSYFETSLRYELKIDSIETVEDIEVGTYSFKTYKIDKESYLSVVYIYATYSNVFLIDYDGKLYTELLQKIKPEYKNSNLNKKRFVGNYNTSLAKKNLIESYFRSERMEF